MSLEIVVVLSIAVISIILFATDKLRVDLVALIIMSVLLLSGYVTPEDGISGFSNTATVTVGAMFIISAALFRTGAINYIGRVLVRLGRRSFWYALISIVLGIGFISAFINNTAAVAIFMPIVLGLAREINTSPSKLLMPLSYASMFGGSCTLIGTSTNILVSSIAERYGIPGFSMFEFASMGLVFFFFGFLYMVTIGVRMIPERTVAKDLTEDYNMNEYLAEIILKEGAQSIGSTIAKSPLVEELDMDIFEITRGGRKRVLPAGNTILREDDILKVRCNVENIKKLQEREGVVMKPHERWKDEDLKSEESTLVEAVIAPYSSLEGTTLKRYRFRNVFGGTVLAIRHRGTIMHAKLETTKLKAGDTLLIEVEETRRFELVKSKDFVFVSDVGLQDFRKHKIIPALLILFGVVLTAALNIFPIVVSAVAGCVLLVLTGCINLEEAYDAIEWKVIFLLAGVITLGVALEATGAAALLSTLMISIIGPFGPVALVSAFFLLSSLLTGAMSNNATAALLAPIAIVAAGSMGVDAKPFLMAVTFAASASFMTPVGYQTNLMIYEPGHFKFRDFLKVGTPLNILFWILGTIFIPYFWSF